MEARPADPSRDPSRVGNSPQALAQRPELRFVVVGLSNFVVSYSVYSVSLLLLPLGALAIRAGLSQLFAYAAGTLWSFYWNRRWTFAEQAEASNRDVRGQAVRFVALQLGLMALSSVSISATVSLLGISPTLAWFGVMTGITVGNFLLSKYIVFR